MKHENTRERSGARSDAREGSTQREPTGGRLTAAAAYDRWAPSYGERMNPLQVMEADLVEQLLVPVAEKVVLDLGCGAGRLLRVAVERGAARVVGADLSLRMLHRAAAAVPAAEVLRADVAALPLPDAVFDLVTCCLVLGHSQRLPAALGEIERVLRPGGAVLLTDFHPDATRRGWERTFTDPATGAVHAIEQHLHPIEDYHSLLAELGVEVVGLEEAAYQGNPVVFGLLGRKRL